LLLQIRLTINNCKGFARLANFNRFGGAFFFAV